jgi:hypothetical protein
MGKLAGRKYKYCDAEKKIPRCQESLPYIISIVPPVMGLD